MAKKSAQYVLDTSVLTQAHRVYYPFDIAPPFWSFLIKAAKTNNIISIDRVSDEILKGNDKLASWVKNDFSFAFEDTKNNSKVLTSYASLMQWANNQTQYTQAAKNEFARAENADAWVIAFAMSKSCTLVTQEVFKKEIKRKIPIPNVCKVFNIDYIDTFKLLRELDFKFS